MRKWIAANDGVDLGPKIPPLSGFIRGELGQGCLVANECEVAVPAISSCSFSGQLLAYLGSIPKCFLQTAAVSLQPGDRQLAQVGFRLAIKVAASSPEPWAAWQAAQAALKRFCDCQSSAKNWVTAKLPRRAWRKQRADACPSRAIRPAQRTASSSNPSLPARTAGSRLSIETSFPQYATRAQQDFSAPVGISEFDNPRRPHRGPQQNVRATTATRKGKAKSRSKLPVRRSDRKRPLAMNLDPTLWRRIAIWRPLFRSA